MIAEAINCAIRQFGAYLRLPTWVEAVPTISADFPESLIAAIRDAETGQ